MRDPSQSVGQSAEAKELRLLADDLGAVLVSQMPHLITATSRDDWNTAQLYGRTARGLLRYHFWMADTSPARMTRLMGLRDQLMAENLLAIPEHTAVLIHAHNAHLQRNKSLIRMGDQPVEWWSAGALMDAHMGTEYAFLPALIGTLRHHGVEDPPADTIEGLLHTLPVDHGVIDSARLASVIRDLRPVPRVSPYYGYIPVDPSHLADDGPILFVKDVIAPKQPA